MPKLKPWKPTGSVPKIRIGAIAAIVAAGLCAPAASVVAEERTLVTVDGKPITETDLRLAEREIGANPNVAPKDARRLLIELLIQRQVLAAAAEADQLQTGTDFDQRIAYARRSVLQDLFLEKQARATVTEADAKRVYDEQANSIKPEEEVWARHILLEREAAARTLRERIAKGADFQTQAKTVSADLQTARDGGDLGWRTRGELPDELAAAAFELQNKGDLSPPVQTQAGWHLIFLEQRRMRALALFAELKDSIIDILVKNKASELARGLREKADVVYDDASLKPVAKAKP